jgi:hypothetical protein
MRTSTFRWLQAFRKPQSFRSLLEQKPVLRLATDEARIEGKRKDAESTEAAFAKLGPWRVGAEEALALVPCTSRRNFTFF